MKRNPFIARAALAVALVAPAASFAQGAGGSYPAQAVRIIVLTPPGGGSDVLTRVIAERMSDGFKQPVVIDNRPGASGAIAAEAAARAAPDGYTLFAGTSSTLVTLPLVNPKLPYDANRDYAPIGLFARADNVIVARANAPFDSLASLVAYARANPGRVSYGTAGMGTTQHLAAELLQDAAKIELLHVPYKGTALAQADLVSGRIDLMFDNVPPAATNIRAGKARALAVASPKRLAEFPATPTTAEAGFPAVEVYGWVGLFAPRATPRPVVERLSAELKRVLAIPEVGQRLVQLGNDVIFTTPDETSAYIRTETDKWRKLIRERKLTFD
jgi:tripartite-type tricarboxylate transporter receptor subunit TctC